MNQIATIPNLLTVSRLCLLPVTIVLFRAGHCIAAGSVFTVAMLTDCVDGWLAKRLKQETLLGLYLDPVVDKILILSLFYELAHADLISWIVAHFFLARELLQNAIRAVAASRGTVAGANWMGKTKATLQTILIAWGLCMPALSGSTDASIGKVLSMCTWIVLGITWSFFVTFVIRIARTRDEPGTGVYSTRP